MHPKGIGLLKRSFTLFDLKGLNNNQLLKKILTLSKKTTNQKDALIIRSVRDIDKQFIKQIATKTNIRLVCTVSAGFDNIDIAACSKHKIDVMNVAGANSTSAAEFTFASILAITKNIIPASVDMKKGIFNYRKINNIELSGKTIGIIGVGRIGSKVAKLARAFGMNVIGNDIDPKVRAKYKFIKFTSLNRLISSSDIVTIHTPLDKTTKNIINKNNLKLFKSTSILINCSRGGTVEENALIESLKENKLHYSAVDVFENEPSFNKNFTKLNNVLLSPHLAGKTVESRQRMGIEAAKKVTEYFISSFNKHKLVY